MTSWRNSLYKQAAKNNNQEAINSLKQSAEDGNIDSAKFLYTEAAAGATHLQDEVQELRTALGVSSTPEEMLKAVGYETRLVFDMGTGGTKTLLALYDTQAKKIHKKIKEVSLPINYKKMIKDSKQLIENDQIKNIADYQELIKDVYKVDCSQIKCMGYSTAWARDIYVDNLNQYLGRLASELNISIIPLTQNKEGHIGYKTVLEATGGSANDVLVWDIGNGSFQLSTINSGKFHMNGAAYGSTSFLQAVKSHLGIISDDSFDLTQINNAKAYASTLLSNSIKNDTVLAGMKADLASKNTVVYGIGGVLKFSIIPLIHQSTKGGSSFTKTQVNHYLDHSNEIKDALDNGILNAKFTTHQQVQTNLLLVHTIMEAAGIDKVDVIEGAQATSIIANENIWDGNPLNCNPSVPETCFLDAA